MASGTSPVIAHWPPPDGTRRRHVPALLAEPVVKLMFRHVAYTADEMLGPARRRRRRASRSDPFELRRRPARDQCSGREQGHGAGPASVRRGIGAEAVVAFGDMPNDLSMLRWAGHGVAVAGAHPDVLAAAEEVAPGTTRTAWPGPGQAVFTAERSADDRSRRGAGDRARDAGPGHGITSTGTGTGQARPPGRGVDLAGTSRLERARPGGLPVPVGLLRPGGEFLDWADAVAARDSASRTRLRWCAGTRTSPTWSSWPAPEFPSFRPRSCPRRWGSRASRGADRPRCAGGQAGDWRGRSGTAAGSRR